MPINQQNANYLPLHILIVEDNRFLGYAFEQTFHDDFMVSIATGVDDGWRIYQSRPANIALVDINLPDGSGHELARRIKESSPETFVVMATASIQREDRDEARRNRIDDYILKPFDRRKIMDVIDRYHAARYRFHSA